MILTTGIKNLIKFKEMQINYAFLLMIRIGNKRSNLYSVSTTPQFMP